MLHTEAVPMFSPELRRGLGRLLALTLLVTAGLVIGSPALAATNLVQNPGLEQLGADGFPVCWEKSGQGDNTSTLTSTAEGRTGKGLRVAVTRLNDGDRKAMMTESAQCAPRVTVGRQYDLSVWYKSSTAANAMTLFRHDTKARLAVLDGPGDAARDQRLDAEDGAHPARAGQHRPGHLGCVASTASAR